MEGGRAAPAGADRADAKAEPRLLREIVSGKRSVGHFRGACGDGRGVRPGRGEGNEGGAHSFNADLAASDVNLVGLAAVSHSEYLLLLG